MAKHGCEGYTIWVLCLELLGKEGSKGRLDAKSGWKNGLVKVLGWSDDSKLNVILDTIADLDLINSKALKFGHLYIPRFIKRADDYTLRKIRTMSEHDTNNVHVEEKRIDKNRIDKIIEGYITKKNFNPNNDKDIKNLLFKRNVRVAKELLVMAENNDETVVSCMNWFADICNKKNLSWTLETILKWLPEYKARGSSISYDQIKEKFGI
jgi:hypothetical protein